MIDWLGRYQHRLLEESSNDERRRQAMLKTNPRYILRNYMAEMAIKKAHNDYDYSDIETLLNLLQTPYDEHPQKNHYADLPPDWAQQIAVSCSS